jgi:hypothetical protein
MTPYPLSALSHFKQKDLHDLVPASSLDAHKHSSNHATQPNTSKERIQMNEFELDENSDVAQSCPSDEYSEDDYSLDSRIASQNQYCGR